jgi:hypothetical protein
MGVRQQYHGIGYGGSFRWRKMAEWASIHQADQFPGDGIVHFLSGILLDS